MAGEAKSPGTRGVSWRERETLDLLSLWGEERVQEALERRHRNLEVFEEIALQMGARGHRRSATECRTKTKGLRQEYWRAVAQNRRPGATPAPCPYYPQLDRILREGAAQRPRPRPLPSQPKTPRRPDRTRAEDLCAVDLDPLPGGLAPTESPPSGGVDGRGPSPDLDKMCISTQLGHGKANHFPGLPTVTEQAPTENPPSGGLDSRGPSPDLDKMCISMQLEHAEATLEACLEERPEAEPDFAPTTSTARQQGDNLDEDLLIPLQGLSSETRLEKARKRVRRVALLNNVAEKMLEQSKLEKDEAARLIERWMMKEDQRHKAMRKELLEEGERDRKLFKETMQQSVTVMVAAVGVLKKLSNFLQDRTSTPVAQDRGPPNSSTLPQASRPLAVASTQTGHHSTVLL